MTAEFLLFKNVEIIFVMIMLMLLPLNPRMKLPSFMHSPKKELFC